MAMFAEALDRHEAVDAVLKFELTEKEKANGWIVKTKADYLRSSHGVNPVYVGE